MQRILQSRWVNPTAVIAGCCAVFGHWVASLSIFVLVYSECGKVAPFVAKLIATGALCVYGLALFTLVLATPVLFALRHAYKIKQGLLPSIWIAMAVVGAIQGLGALQTVRDGAYIDIIVAGDTTAFRKMEPRLTPEKRRDALWLAARWGRLEIVRLLVESGGDPNGRLSGSGSTIMEAARENLGKLPDGNDAVVDYLIAHGAR